jgi:signal transduction histidine kinase
LTLLEGIADQIAGPIKAADLYEQALMGAKEREQRILVEAEKREIERISEAKSEFISTVSHELKTPLTCISAFIDILAKNRSNNLVDRQLEQLGVMRRNGHMLDLLISDLVDVSRIDSERFKLSIEPFDARSMLSDLTESFRPILESKNQTLVVEDLDCPVWLRADHARIIQVLNNLLSNACKYSGSGANIKLIARATESTVEFVIEDDGIGIRASDLEQLFTMFFRSDNSETRSVAGTGLGLAIAKTIVDLHGGEIDVESELGVGTRLSFFIPGVIDASEAVSELGDRASLFPFGSRLDFLNADDQTETRPAA